MSKAAILNLDVSFGNLNVGDKTARLGVSINRSEPLTITQADKNLCGRRLTGKIKAKPPGENSDQATLPGMEDQELKGVFDVKNLSITTRHIGIGLTFALASVDVATLAHFAKRSGKLTVTDVEEIPENENGKEDEDEDDEA